MFDMDGFHPLDLAARLTANPVVPEPQATTERRILRSAAVLIPILWSEYTWSLLFTRRSELLKKHTGQVAFPGGSADENDADLAETALREAYEEIALPAENVKILGYMPAFEANSGFHVTPVAAWVHTSFTIVPSEAEVARVFTVPLAWFLDPAHLQLRRMETPWGRMENVVFYEPYDNELVWGFTGCITMEFMKIIAQTLK